MSQHCRDCGVLVPAGAGRRSACLADTGCPEHLHEDGWHIYCLDGAGCSARQDARRAAAIAEEARLIAIRALEARGERLGREGWAMVRGSQPIVLEAARPGSGAPSALLAFIGREGIILSRPEDAPLITLLPIGAAEEVRRLAVAAGD